MPLGLKHRNAGSTPALEAAYVEYMVMCQLRWSAMVSGSAHHRANCAAESAGAQGPGAQPTTTTTEQQQQHAAYLALAAQHNATAAQQMGGTHNGNQLNANKLPLAPLARSSHATTFCTAQARSLAARA